MKCFMKEITEGLAGTPIKSGVIKMSTSKRQITYHETRLIKATEMSYEYQITLDHDCMIIETRR